MLQMKGELIMCDVWPVVVQDCQIPLYGLINDPRSMTQVCIDKRKCQIELCEMESDSKLPDDFLLLPTFEELYNFNEAVRRYVDMLDIAIEKSPLRFLKTTGQMTQFREWYTEQAVDRLIQYLKNEGCCIKDFSVKYEIVKRLSESEVTIPEEKIKEIVLDEDTDNIRVLVGYVYRYIAEKQLKKVEQYAKEHPTEVVNCTIIIE